MESVLRQKQHIHFEELIMLFTIFTPTYNRSALLMRVFESLKKQTFTDFEWLIVNDSSPDDTDEVVAGFIAENPFPIVYKKQEHGGKMRAMNKAGDLACGEWIMIHDDDDYMPENALEITAKYVEIANSVPNCDELSGMKIFTNGKNVRAKIPGEYVITDFAERRKKGWIGDEGIFYRNSVFKTCKATEFEGEYDSHFSIPAFKMCKQGSKMLMFNDIVYIGDYLEDGLSYNTQQGAYLLGIFNGYTEGVNLELELDVGLKRKIGVIGKYTFIARQKGLSYSDIENKIHKPIYLCFTLGLLVKLYFNIVKIIASNKLFHRIIRCRYL